jgi:hypothetical protein
MTNLLYGGISYPNTAFVFDRVYSNYAEANAAANLIEITVDPESGKETSVFVGDGVLLNRYVLVAYSNNALTQYIKNDIENYANGGTKPTGYEGNAEWQ